MTIHPEQKDTEIYLGNVAPSWWTPSRLADFRTLRLGSVAYDLNGKVLSADHGIVPLFIDRSELDRYDEVQTANLREIRGW